MKEKIYFLLGDKGDVLKISPSKDGFVLSSKQRWKDHHITAYLKRKNNLSYMIDIHITNPNGKNHNKKTKILRKEITISGIRDFQERWKAFASEMQTVCLKKKLLNQKKQCCVDCRVLNISPPKAAQEWILLEEKIKENLKMCKSHQPCHNLNHKRKYDLQDQKVLYRLDQNTFLVPNKKRFKKIKSLGKKYFSHEINYILMIITKVNFSLDKLKQKKD